MKLLNKGKAKIISLVILIACVICAVFAYFAISFNKETIAENEETTTTVEAPENIGQTTATTTIADPYLIAGRGSPGTLSANALTFSVDTYASSTTTSTYAVAVSCDLTKMDYTLDNHVSESSLTNGKMLVVEGTVPAMNTYGITFKPKSGYAFASGKASVRVCISVQPQLIDYPTLVTGYGTSGGTLSNNDRTYTLEYSGSTFTPAVRVSGYNSDKMDYSCGTGVNATAFTGGRMLAVASGSDVSAGKSFTISFTAGAYYNFSSGSKGATVTLKIQARDISNSTSITYSGISDSGYTYTGNAIKPEPTVTYGSTTLTKNTDYTLDWSNYTNVGTGTVTVTGKGNYTGTKELTYTIKRKAVTVPTLTKSTDVHKDASVDKQTATTYFNGKAQHFTIQNVTDFDKITFSGLSSGATRSDRDFYATNVNTSGYTVTMSLGSNYCWGYDSKGVADTANKTLKIVINKADQSAPTVTASTSVTYGNKITLTASGGSSGKYSWSVASSTGSNATASLSATSGTTVELTGTKVGGTVTVTCYSASDDNYTTSSKYATNTITIEQRDVKTYAKFGTIGTNGVLTYTGDAIKPEPSITDKDNLVKTTLVKDTDFTYSWENNVDAGTAKVIITGNGNFKGTKEATFTISGKSVKGAEFSKIDDLTYDGTAKKPTATITLDGVTLSSTTDFDFSWENNVNAGTATIKIAGKGNYSGDESSTFTILAKSISGVKFDPITDKTYTGVALTPTFTVKDGDRTLVKDTHYTVEYTNNVNAGTATITITGKGNYKDDTTAETSFEILKGKIAGTSFSTISAYIYDGSAKTPKPTVTLGTTTLVEDVDFEFSWENNIAVGQGKVIITGINNYEGTNFANFTIRYATIGDATVVVDLSTAYTYDGTAKTPTVESVKVGNVTLAEGTDYTVTYQSNINAGTDTAKVIINGMGTYAGSQTVTFSISPADLSTAVIEGVDASYEYAGSAIKPAFTVTLDAIALVSGRDYSVTYANNVELGTATITVTGTANYTGTITKTFIIDQADISNAVISGFNTEYPYTGNAITPAITVTLGSRTLVKDTDYTVAYAQNVELGTAVITVTGINNYQGTVTASFTIVPADISTAVISGINQSYNYTGSAITPTPAVTFGTVTLAVTTDFTVSYAQNVALGTATLTVTGTGNYTGSVSTTFDIIEADLSTATIEGIDASYTYTGVAITPAPVVKFGTLTLVKDTDYTVTYSDNLNVGTATITVTGKGNFKLTASVTFEITEADITSATIDGVDASYTFTGTAIQPTVTVKLGTVTLTLTTEYTVAYTDNVNVGTATITVTGTGNYTGTATTTFEIDAKDLFDATVEGLNTSYTYTGNGIEPNVTVKLDNTTLVLNTDYTVSFTDNVDVGTATLTVTGKGNYGLTVTKTFDITKATPEVTVTFDDYDGVSVRYAGTAIPAISYTATFGGNAITGTLSWEATVLVSGTTDYKWTFVPDNANLDKVENTKFINVVAPDIASLTVSWKDGSQPDLYTSTTLEQVKAYLKVEATLTNGSPFGNEILAGAYRLVGSWTNDGDKPTRGGTYTLQVYLKEYPSVPPATLSDVVYTDVKLTGITYEVLDGQTLTTEYTALDKFDTAKIKVLASYNDGREPVEVAKDAGRGGYKVVYADGHDCLWYGDTQVTISFTDGTVTKTCTIIDLTVEKKVFDTSAITFNDKTVTYNGKDFTITANGFTLGTVTYTYVKKADGEPDETLSVAKAKNAGVYVVTAHFTFTGQINIVNYEEIEDITKTLTIEKARHDEEVILPSVTVDYNNGKPLADSIKVKNLPAGVEVTYVYKDEDGNAIKKEDIKNAGTYTVTVNFTDTDEDNYEKIEPITATFTINKIEPAVKPTVSGTIANGAKLSDLVLAGEENGIKGTYTWENAEQTLKNGRNVCWYTFTPDEEYAQNYTAVKSYFEWDIVAEGVTGLSTGALTGILIGALIGLVVAIIALTVAIKARKNEDVDGFNDEVTEEDLVKYDFPY